MLTILIMIILFCQKRESRHFVHTLFVYLLVDSLTISFSMYFASKLKYAYQIKGKQFIFLNFHLNLYLFCQSLIFLRL
jgi:hypothetical protein